MKSNFPLSLGQVTARPTAGRTGDGTKVSVRCPLEAVPVKVFSANKKRFQMNITRTQPKGD